MSIEKIFWMIFWYVMSNAGNAYGIMQISTIKYQLVKRLDKRYRLFINLRKLIHPAQLHIIFSKIWKLKFHGILSFLKHSVLMIPMVPLNNNRFHGIPWNWHQQFHGISWNLECANIDDTSSSMEFHGTRSAPISMTRADPWNSMELWVRQFRWHQQFHGIPWNLECANFADTTSSMEFHSMELQVRQLRWHEQFQGISWNSMELGVRQFRWHEQFQGIPWNSMELGGRQIRWHGQFHGIPWN